jgi:polar amino acid transport system substrate-binding protein
MCITRTKLNSLLIIILLATSCFSLLVKAASLEEIKILTEEYPPYNYLNSEGHLAGTAVDLLVKAYAETGIVLDTQNIKIQPWPRSYRQLLRSSNTMLFSMTRNAQREKLFKWAGPISNTKVVLMAKKNRNIMIKTADEIKKYIIGGIRDDIGLQLVSQLLTDVNIKHVISVPTVSSLTGMLKLNRIDLWAYEENAAKLFLKRYGLDATHYEAVYTLSEAQLYFAFGLNTEQKIVDRLQKAIDSVN